MTMTLIETKTLASAAASIEFTSIPQDGTDLLAVVSGRATNADPLAFFLEFNGVTSGYAERGLEGNGSSAAAFSNAGGGTKIYSGVINWNTSTANTFSSFSFYIPNYAGATNKSVSIDQVTEDNGTTSWQTILAGLWANTSAITSTRFFVTTGNLAIGTTISLYKITKGSDGIVTTS